MIIVYYSRLSAISPYIHWNDIRNNTHIWKLWLEWASARPSPHTIHFFPMANELMKQHVSRGDLNSPHQKNHLLALIGKASWKTDCMELNKARELRISTCHIRRSMTNTSPTLYCICWVTVLFMLQRLKSAIAVFVFEQLELRILCVSAIHARRTICKDYVMNCLSILYKTSLITTTSTHLTWAVGISTEGQ